MGDDKDWDVVSEATTSSTWDCPTPSSTMTEKEKEVDQPSEEQKAPEADKQPPKDNERKEDDRSPPKGSEKEKEVDKSPEDTEKPEAGESPPKDSNKTEKKESISEGSNNIPESELSGSNHGGKSKELRIISASPPECHPKPGKNQMIRTHKKPYRYLAQKYGELVWLERPIPSGGHIWHCELKEGCFGFRNMASGNYLGQDGESQDGAAQGGESQDGEAKDGEAKVVKLVATEDQHGPEEYFSEMRKPDGGYMLLTHHSHTRTAIGFSDDSKSLIEKKDSEEAFDFIDVDHLETTIKLAFPDMPKETLRKK